MSRSRVSLVLRLVLIVCLILVLPALAGAATYTVTNTLDAAVGVPAGSLRKAIQDANSNPGSTIIFDSAVHGGTITLAAGFFTISANMTISGPGPALLTIDGNTSSHIFYIDSGTIKISGLTIANGYNSAGGGVVNYGNLTLTNCVVSGNSAAIGTSTVGAAVPGGTGGSGGGIYNDGTLTVENCTIENNAAGDGGLGGSVAGSAGAAGGAGGEGGGIFSAYGSTLTITDSKIYNNSAGDGGDGGPGDSPTGFTGTPGYNGGSGGDGGCGGGVYSDDDGTRVTIKNTTFESNHAGTGGDGGAGGNGATGSGVNGGAGGSGGAAGSGGYAGGLYLGPASDSTVESSTFYSNITGSGGVGGAGGDGGVSIGYSGGAGGTGGNGGYGGNGGGAFQSKGNLNVDNSTFSNNSTAYGGNGGNGGDGGTGVTGGSGAVGGDGGYGGAGGGIAVPMSATPSITVDYCTIANNSTGSGGSGGAGGVDGGVALPGTPGSDGGYGSGGGLFDEDTGLVNVGNTILANNTAGTSTGPDCYSPASHAIHSMDYNLILDPSGCYLSGTTTHNRTGQNPLLETLQNNGGDTDTHALPESSPAIDAANPADYPGTDQRGTARPADGNGDGTAAPDIGAYERSIGADLTVTIEGQDYGSVTSDPSGIDCPSGTCSTSYNVGTVVTLTAATSAGASFVGWSGDCSGTDLQAQVTMNTDKACTASFSSFIDEVYPAPDSTGQPLGIEPWVIFIDPMKASTINTDTFTLYKMETTADQRVDRTQIAGTVTYSTDSQKATFAPSARLELGRSYEAVISGSVENENSEHMGYDYRWTFTTTDAQLTRTISLAAGHGVANYRIVSMPMLTDDTYAPDAFGIDPEDYNPRDMRIGRWKAASRAYAEFPDVGDVGPGFAAWMLFRNGRDLNLTGTATVATTNGTTGTVGVAVDIEPGWNQIGNPYNSQITVANIKVYNTAGNVYNLTAAGNT